MTIIKIEPIDTLFFRDAKPFNMGDDAWAEGIFPPYPSVIYGALRGLYFSENTTELSKVGTPEDSTLNFKIKKIYYGLGENNYPFFPLPLDLVYDKKNSSNLTSNDEHIGANLYKNIFPLELDDITISSSEISKTLIKVDTDVETVDNGVILSDSLKEYLKRNYKKLNISSFNFFKKEEPKTGVGINNLTGATQESKLYRVNMNSFKKLTIIVEFEGLNLDFKNSKLIKLGAEGKTALCKEDKALEINIDIKNSNNIKLYLSTPALFEKGWIPKFVNKIGNDYIWEYKKDNKSIKLKLISSIIGKPLLIGGFDMKNKIPKKMRKAVPAGSVYYFSKCGDDLDDNDLLSELISEINGKSISDYSTNEGFGIAFLGAF